MATVSEEPDRGRRDVPAGVVRSTAEAGRSAMDGEQLARAAGGRLLRAGQRAIRGGSVDSRIVRPGEAFFALPGERSDGHAFLEEAVAAGAAAVVITKALAGERLDALWGPSRDVSVVVVPDAAEALRGVASAWRDRFDPTVVGITGSLAKTSTKEQVAELLAAHFRVLRSAGNLNNEIGLPLSLLRLDDSHEVAVLEMGLYTTGEIALLARLARPSIGVVTAVREVHLSRAGSLDAIEAGKRELVEALPRSGWAVLNADDARVRGMAAHTQASCLTYGFADHADVIATSVTSLGALGMRFVLRLPEGSHSVTTPALGRHGVHNALAAAAVATCLGMAASDIVDGLAREAPAPHRSQLIRAGGWTILDDSYNASPDAMAAALDLLADLPGRRLAVLGEMLELGVVADAAHRQVGRHAARSVHRLIVVGEGARGIAEGAAEAGLAAAAIELAADRPTALQLLLAQLRTGDTVLVKASRGAALDLLVDELVRVVGEPGARA
ncbi:UDP-N-acetylmuramoyl-tripeptide--D-alanyl-D-alanine ligase [soil metagenome]